MRLEGDIVTPQAAKKMLDAISALKDGDAPPPPAPDKAKDEGQAEKKD